MFQQQERHVIVGVTGGVPDHGSHQGVECLVAVRCEECRFDRVFREEKCPWASRLSTSPSV